MIIELNRYVGWQAFHVAVNHSVTSGNPFSAPVSKLLLLISNKGAHHTQSLSDSTKYFYQMFYLDFQTEKKDKNSYRKSSKIGNV